MHFKPQPHKCTKCGYEHTVSPISGILASADGANFIPCPKCWLEFLQTSVGELKCTVDFGRGSAYSRHMENKEELK